MVVIVHAIFGKNLMHLYVGLTSKWLALRVAQIYGLLCQSFKLLDLKSLLL